VSSRAKQKSEQSPSRLLLWVAIAGLIFGLIGFGELPEDVLRSGRNSLHPHSASGDIIFVSIDDRSLREVERWPWPRRYHAQITEKLTAAGANRIFFDVMFENRSNPADDALFAEALKRSGRVTLPVRSRSGPDTDPNAHSGVPDSVPLDLFSRHTRLGTISVRYNYQNAVWHLPYALKVNDQLTPSFAASLAHRQTLKENGFTPDYSVVPSTIPTISAAAVLRGDFSAAQVRGKDVVIVDTAGRLHTSGSLMDEMIRLAAPPLVIVIILASDCVIRTEPKSTEVGSTMMTGLTGIGLGGVCAKAMFDGSEFPKLLKAKTR
jgi:Predicted transmembrane sensor domain